MPGGRGNLVICASAVALRLRFHLRLDDVDPQRFTPKDAGFRHDCLHRLRKGTGLQGNEAPASRADGGVIRPPTPDSPDTPFHAADVGARASVDNAVLVNRNPANARLDQGPLGKLAELVRR